MADGQDQVTAMVSDPDFMKLSPQDMQAALTAHDPMFGKVGPADIARFVQAHQAPKAPAAPMGVPKEQMQESSAPNYFRGATAALPVAGGIAGAIAGAPAFGGGALVGGGLGAAGGEAARQDINNLTFGDETSLPQIGVVGLIGAASEIPGAIAVGRGNYLLKVLGQAKDLEQVGNVLQAFKSVNPVAGTKAGLQEGLEMANKKIGAQLGQVLHAATGTVDVGNTIELRAYAESAVEDAGFARGNASTSRVTNAVRDAITAAKSNAGITGNTANAEQLWKFQQQINNKAFKKAIMNQDPTVGSVVNRILQSTSRNSGVLLRSIAPDADPLLQHMTDIHAGINALQNVGNMGRTGAISVSAALNPRITAILSIPTAAAVAAGTQIPAVKRGTDFLTKTTTTP